MNMTIGWMTSTQSQPFAGSSSTLGPQLSTPSHWPHSAILLSSGSSAGIGTSVSLILEDGGDVGHVVAERQVIVNENGEAPTVFRGLDAGAHRLQATMSSAGLEAVAETAFTVVEGEIDTFLRGAAVMDRALFTLDSTQPLSTEYYEYSLDGNEWTIHRENHLYVGPMAPSASMSCCPRRVLIRWIERLSLPGSCGRSRRRRKRLLFDRFLGDALASAVSKRGPGNILSSIDDGLVLQRANSTLSGPLSRVYTLRCAGEDQAPAVSSGCRAQQCRLEAPDVAVAAGQSSAVPACTLLQPIVLDGETSTPRRYCACRLSPSVRTAVEVPSLPASAKISPRSRPRASTIMDGRILSQS